MCAYTHVFQTRVSKSVYLFACSDTYVRGARAGDCVSLEAMSVCAIRRVCAHTYIHIQIFVYITYACVFTYHTYVGVCDSTTGSESVEYEKRERERESERAREGEQERESQRGKARHASEEKLERKSERE